MWKPRCMNLRSRWRNGGFESNGLEQPVATCSARASAELAKEAEDLGYTDAWTAETSGPDAFSRSSRCSWRMRISSSRSRVNSEYSVCRAVIG